MPPVLSWLAKIDGLSCLMGLGACIPSSLFTVRVSSLEDTWMQQEEADLSQGS